MYASTCAVCTENGARTLTSEPLLDGRGNRLKALIFAAALLGAQLPAGFVPLFDGTLTGWVVENTTAGNIGVRDGLLRISGPGGWLRSEREYADFDLRIELRFVTDDADSGLFFRAPGKAMFGPGWPNNSYQVQMRNPLGLSRFPPVGGLFRHGMPPGSIEFDAAAVAKVTKGTGEWQVLEIEAVRERLVVRFNGTEVTRATDLVPGSGYIGLQGETGAVEVRSIGIRERRP